MPNKKYIPVGGHHVLIPEPKKRSDIFFIDDKKQDAFWHRDKLLAQYRDIWFNFIPKSSKSPIYTKMWQPATIYDEDGLLVSLNEKDSNYIDSIYKQEVDRRINGIHFKNDDEIVWITGDMYYFLMYARMQRHDGKGLYADYREFQSEYFYLIHHACINNNILGLFTSKAKKTGITNAHWSGFYLNRATLYKNKNLGYMNINLPQAAKTFCDYFLYSYNGLISPLKPEWKHKSEKDGSITFAESYRNSKKVVRPNSEDESDLNTSVFCVPTKPKAFDVAVMSHITFDEPTKYEESFAEIWRTNKEAVKIQSKFNGRAWLFNYTPEEDSQSFKDAREVFDQSELKHINDLSGGQTKSGLINHHIPAYASWEGSFDKYGRCDEAKAAREIEFERSKVTGNKRALQAITRQYANNKKEAWFTAGAGTIFDNIRLAELKVNLRDLKTDSPEGVGVEGRFEWERPLWNIGLRNIRKKGEFCPVKFVPLTKDQLAKGEKGRVRLFYDVPTNHINMGLRNGRDEDGCLLPPEKFLYVGGGDPTQYAAGSEIIEGSKNASYTLSMPDLIYNGRNGGYKTKVLMSELLHRPELPDEAFEDFLMEILYFGKLVTIEGNASYVATRLLEEGMGHYMIIKDENGNYTQWKRWMGLATEIDKKYQLVKTTATSTSNDLLETFIRVIKNYIEKPDKNEIDYGETIMSEELIDQLMNFDSKNTKIFDLVMAFGYTLFTYEIYMAELLSPQEDLYSSYNIGSVLAALMR